MKPSPQVLGIFAKYWQPGAVKTRLGLSIGNAAAAELYRVFVETMLLRFQALDARLQLCFDPIERQAEFDQVAGATWQVIPQCDGDLGRRMHYFFDDAFRNGAQRAVLIGSDTPNLPLGIVQQAMSALDNVDVVLGPSLDGGYYLIGLAHDIPSIFDDISWSTPHVWQQTVERLVDLRLPFVQLAPWYDVDEFDDLERLRNDLILNPQEDLQALLKQVRRALES